MDEYRENVKKAQKALNQDAAFIQPNPYLAQRVLNAANKECVGIGGVVLKRKMPIALIIAITLMLSGAIAATLLHLHIEKAMDITKDKGAFSAWELEDKLALIGAMNDSGVALPQDMLAVVNDKESSTEEKNQAVNKLLSSIYGSEEHISHFTIASHDWGDPFQWTLEQKEWFWETLRAKGLYTGEIQYLLPEENDLTREQVVQLAKQAVQDAYALSDDVIQSYDADVTFFTIVGTDTEARWRVYLGHAEGEAAEYAVLLTRDGQVTEDASLYIFNPETLAAQDACSEKWDSSVKTPYQQRMAVTDVFYLSLGNGQYHFLIDCPSVSGEKLSVAEHIDGYEPCLYCVLQTQLWSVEEKILYGVMGGDLPCESVIPVSQAEQIAKDYLLSCGMENVNTLTPYSRYLVNENESQYVVFFAQLENGQINPIYSVTIDAENGDVVHAVTIIEHGNG